MRTYFQAGLRTNSSDPRIAFGKINLIQMEYPGRLVRRSITSLARLRPPPNENTARPMSLNIRSELKRRRDTFLRSSFSVLNQIEYTQFE